MKSEAIPYNSHTCAIQILLSLMHLPGQTFLTIYIYTVQIYIQLYNLFEHAWSVNLRAYI